MSTFGGDAPRRRILQALVAVAVAGTAILAVGTEPAAAIANNGRWAVLPVSGDGPTRRTNFTYNLAPGDAISDEVTVANLTDLPIRFAVYAADAYNTGPNAGLAVRTRDEDREDASAWVAFTGTANAQQTVITVEPRRQVNIPFAVTVPADASPGDHSAGIAALDLDTEVRQRGSVAVGVEHAVAVPLFVRVGGSFTPSLDVQFLSSSATPPTGLVAGGGATRARFQIVNDGNVRLQPVVRAVVRDVFGRTVHRFRSRTLGVLLPGGRAEIEERWGGAPMLGWGSIDVDVEAEAVRVTRASSVRPVPWALLGLVLLVAAARWWVRRRRGHRAAQLLRDQAPRTATP